MILKVHLQGARSYEVGNEIWHESLADAIVAEAETIADHGGNELLDLSDEVHRDALRGQIVAEMSSALIGVGDQYRAPDGPLLAARGANVRSNGWRRYAKPRELGNF